MKEKIHFVSLGCPKNTVDTERMAGVAHANQLELSADPDQADIIVVNTCGFIESAKDESIDTILKMAEYKHQGQCKSLVMAGCLSQRYPQELSNELPEVDHFIGTADLGRLDHILSRDKSISDRVNVGQPEGMEEEKFERALIGQPHTTYLKISEGCNRPCAFCSIPLMRGRQRSRTIESLVDEATQIADAGVKELILVAQDSTAYGSDLPNKSATIEKLLYALNEIKGLEWIRLHYAYPSMIYPPLIQAMAELEHVVPYLDLPIQHVDDHVLRKMRRGYTGKRVYQGLAALREAIPDLWIRTTLLVGHPGETDEAHRALLKFVEEMKIDHLGAFVFSPEEGTAAYDQDEKVDLKLAEERCDEIMALQQKVSRKRLLELHGQTIDVMIDGISDESDYLLVGRHQGQSPEIDGQVILADGEGKPGDIVKAIVEDSAEYDLVAKQLGDFRSE